MNKRITLTEFLGSIDNLEDEIDRSVRALERCLEQLTELEERARRAKQLRAPEPAKPVAAPDYWQNKRSA